MTDTDDFLAHFGVKGMKWGIRKSDPSAGPREPRQPMTKKQKIAIGSAAGVAVLGIAVTAVILKQNAGKTLSDIGDVSAGTEKVKEIFEEPTKLIFSTRSKNKGFRIFEGFDGGIKNPMGELLDRAGFDSNGGDIGSFKRYGDNLEKIKASFLDPQGRVDRAGRVIPHEFVIPKDLAEGINTLDDVKQKIWPMVSDAYDKFYKEN